MSRIARRITQFSQADIKYLFKTAHTLYKHAGLTIKRAPALQEYGRILIVTPKKMGTAPERNTVRRRIKALFYQHKLYQCPYDILVLCSKESITLPFQTLETIFLKTCIGSLS